MTRSFVPGLELAELFYAEVVAPIMEDALAGVPYSAALIGWGSEVQGFDTQRSTDHAWGPRMQVFLGHNDFLARADDLDAVLDRDLPAEFRGYPVRFAFPPGAPARHWVHVTDLRDFFIEHLGADPGSGLTTSAWLTVPTQVLRELTGGVVFHDGLGLLEPYRKQLAWFPDDVWRYVLACQWMRLSQEEPFVGRCGEVGDDLGSAVVAARQVRDLMRLCLLMNRVYPPYSKWLGIVASARGRPGERHRRHPPHPGSNGPDLPGGRDPDAVRQRAVHYRGGAGWRCPGRTRGRGDHRVSAASTTPVKTAKAMTLSR